MVTVDQTMMTIYESSEIVVTIDFAADYGYCGFCRRL